MDKKTLLAFLLIAVVLILMPQYMNLVAPPAEQVETINDSTFVNPPPQRVVPQVDYTATAPQQNYYQTDIINDNLNNADESIITIETSLYSAEISNKNGGSIISFILKKYEATDSTSVQLVDNFNRNNLLFNAMSVEGIPLQLNNYWSISGHPYNIEVGSSPESIRFSTKVEGKTLDQKYRGSTGWVATRNKYFISAIIPTDAGVGASLGGSFEREVPNFNISVTQQVNSSNSFSLYLGPLEYGSVAALGVNLEQSMSMGWAFIRPISRGVLAALVAMHKYIPNYGVVLIIFSILVKVIVYPLTRKSYQSMRAMSSLQPKLQALKEKHAKDPQRLNQATMQLYKEEGVNPMGGCLPMLIQMPLLFALFQVFRSTIELRGEPFMLWITDLSAPDTLFEIGGFPINILPLVMAASMFIQQKMTPTAAGAGQQKSMMYMMNIFFIFIFYRLPSGLNLYYTLFNVLTILQQKYLTPQQASATQPAVTIKKK